MYCEAKWDGAPKDESAYEAFKHDYLDDFDLVAHKKKMHEKAMHHSAVTSQSLPSKGPTQNTDIIIDGVDLSWVTTKKKRVKPEFQYPFIDQAISNHIL